MKQPLATKIIITVFDYIQNVLRLKTADNGRKTMHDFVSIFTTTAQLWILQTLSQQFSLVFFLLPAEHRTVVHDGFKSTGMIL
jgi:hypothetical protein